MRRDREDTTAFSVGLRSCKVPYGDGLASKSTHPSSSFYAHMGKDLMPCGVCRSRSCRWLRLARPLLITDHCHCPYRASVIRPGPQLYAKHDSYRESSQAKPPARPEASLKLWSLLVPGAREKCRDLQATPTPRSSSGLVWSHRPEQEQGGLRKSFMDCKSRSLPFAALQVSCD